MPLIEECPLSADPGTLEGMRMVTCAVPRPLVVGGKEILGICGVRCNIQDGDLPTAVQQTPNVPGTPRCVTQFPPPPHRKIRTVDFKSDLL